MMLLILTLNGTVVMAEDDKKKDADYNIQNTTDGKYNANGTLSLSLKIDSYKEDFNGTIKLYVGNTEWSTYASTAYEKPVSIEKGKSKEIVFEVGYDYEHTGKLWYELIDEKGNVVYDREDSITLMQSGMGMTMGILTDDFSNFSFLNEGSAFQLELWGERVNFTITGLDETTFPEDKNAMDEFDFLFIDQFYTDKLSEEQMNVLLQWLNSGGMLLVGTGANAVDTLSGFDGTDFGIQFNGTTIEQEIHLTEFGISDYENSICGTFLGEEDVYGTVTCSELDVDIDVAYYYDSNVVDSSCVVREYGSGYAFVYPFSFTEENMTASMKKAIIGATTLNTYSQRIIDTLDQAYGYYYSNYELRNVQSILNDIEVPDAVAYLLLFIVYIVLATFITYLILKKKDKREYIWIVIPAWSLVFTLVVMVVSRSSRVTKPIESSVTLVSLNGNQKTSNSFIALTTPDKKGYELNFNSNITSMIADSDNDYVFYNDTKDIRTSVNYTLKEDADGYSLKVDNAKVFEYKYMQASQTETTEENIDVFVEEEGLLYKGTVTNNTDYDLLCVVVRLNGVSCYIGDLKKGETKNFSEMEGGYGFYEEYDSGDKYEDNKMNALQDLSYGICNEYYNSALSQHITSENLVLGIVKNYEVDLIDNEDFKEFNAAIYTQEINNEEIGIRTEYNLDEYLNSYDGDYDVNYGELYSDTLEVTYNVKSLGEIQYALNIGSRAIDYLTAAQVYFYNVNTGDYDLVFEDSDIVELDNYISANGEIRARFVAEGELERYTSFYGVPYIYVFGGENNVEN